MSSTKKLTIQKTNLIRLVAKGHIYNLKYIALAFGFADPYNQDECELEVTPKIQEKILEEIITASDEDIEYVLMYIRDEGCIDI